MAASHIDWFEPAQGGKTFGVANLTGDPTVRDWANGHYIGCWSPDGRYVCFTRYASNGEIYGSNEAAEVHIFDLHTGGDRKVDNGLSPRWAHHHNWLFYVRFADGPPEGAGTEVWWLDVETGKRVLMGHGMAFLGECSYDDRWLFGYVNLRDQDPPRRSFRMEVRENGVREPLTKLDRGFQWVANPRYNVVFTRFPNQGEIPTPFEATRYWCDIDGKNIRVGSVFLEQCHQSWLGNGEYYLLGNSQVRGRKWNQPFPSSLHFLANVRTGDISPCGKSGRFVVGDKPLTIADLRSGDGWVFLEDLSVICYPSHIKDDSGPYDADPKGSPDGTKVSFVSNYDLCNGSVTFITRSASEADDRVEVASTAGFPPSGEIIVGREVIGYTRKTATCFEGLSRKRYDTSGFGFRKYSHLSEGEPVTLFEARCHPEEVWKRLPLPSQEIQRSIGSLDSPLIRQRSTDVYVVIVRKPDRPYLREQGGEVFLVPGESHDETFGYSLLRDGDRVNDTPLRPGETFTLSPGGMMTAVAVEWSGLESPPSNALRVNVGAALRVLLEAPADFSWTRDRWEVAGEESDLVRGLQSEEALKEVHHLYDGVIAREWYNWGTITRRYDLNAEGKATRRLFYHRGDLFRREYYTGDEKHLSTEYLDQEGNVTEMILYEEKKGKKSEYDHWWFDRGVPVRRIGRRPARWIESKTPEMYVKAGDRWVLQDYVGRRPLPVEAVSPGEPGTRP